METTNSSGNLWIWKVNVLVGHEIETHLVLLDVLHVDKAPKTDDAERDEIRDWSGTQAKILGINI